MIRYIALALLVMFGGILQAQVFIQPCDPCDLTPLAVNQVMTGKQCALRIVSDANDLWSGGLFLSGSNRELGILQGRNRDPNSRDWKGCHLESAGSMAKVYAWNDSEISGFDFYTSEYEQREGTWFVIDYQALQAGHCTIGYYNHSCSWTQADPNVSIVIENIPNVDFYVDNRVDMKDFMVLASYWLQDCTAPDWCGQTDIDRNGIVDVNDITLFASYWLWGVPIEAPAAPNNPQPAAEPNSPAPSAEPEKPQTPVDPNVIYSIHDPNGLDEIVLETGQSVRLNVSKETIDINTNSFYLEVFLSDPNSGSIDNREYGPDDPNDPNDAGKAEILAQPRDSVFDYYGPGCTQLDGIQIFAFSLWEPMEDGPIASFVYTATRPGDVALLLIDYGDIPSRREPIIIHQVEPGQTYSASQDPNDIVEFLENLWKTDVEFQQTTSWADWQAFLNTVKSTVAK
jgi:hypothetical protein